MNTLSGQSVLERPSPTSVPYRSVSQYTEYNQCPYRWFLHRVSRAWERPAAWYPHGLGVHCAVEVLEKSGRTITLASMEEAYTKSFEEEMNKLCEKTPDFSQWFASGKYGGADDADRRYLQGLEQVRRYYQWATENPEDKPRLIAGEPAVELRFDVTLGSVRVVGVIDQVLDHRVRDVKTGVKPGDEFQLGTYKVALEEGHGIKVTRGDFWMARAGGPTVPLDLSDWTTQRVTEEFEELDENIKAERFDPIPDRSNCRRCGVASSCEYRVY